MKRVGVGAAGEGSQTDNQDRAGGQETAGERQGLGHAPSLGRASLAFVRPGG